MPTEIRLETDKIDHEYLKIKLPNGRVCRIEEPELGFLKTLQALPASTKIKLMKLTEEQMLSCISDNKKIANDFLIELLNKKWFWRATGDRFDDLIIEIPPSNYTIPELLKKCNSKRPLRLEDIKETIKWFTSEKSEVYTLEGY